MKNIGLHYPGSRRLLLKELQECLKLKSLSVSKEGSFSLMHHGAFELFSLKHYDGGNGKAEAEDSGSASWLSKKEVQRVLEYNIDQIKE